VNDNAEDDDRFLGPRIDSLDEGLQGGGTSGDVADREDAGGHGVFEFLPLVSHLIVELVGDSFMPPLIPCGGVRQAGGSEWR
jgi:hypothetical protein